MTCLFLGSLNIEIVENYTITGSNYTNIVTGYTEYHLHPRDYWRGFNYITIKPSLENRCGLNFYLNFNVFTLYTLNS